MKIIYAVGICGEPYKVTVDDEMLARIRTIKSTLKSGEVWLNIYASCLTDGSVPGYISISKKRVDIMVQGVGGRESLLDFGGDLMTLPSVHLTKMFVERMGEIVFSLGIDDIDLIDTWREKQLRKLISDSD